MKVAFVGLGNMGSGVAACILRAGYDLTVWNRTESKMDTLVKAGALPAKTVKEAVANADVVITSLMDDKSVLERLEGDNGFLDAMRQGAVHLCITTISPGFADELEQIHQRAGTRFVAGPVAGRPDSAAAGKLLTFLGGEASAIADVKKLCEAYAHKVKPLSDRPSAAYKMKLCVNYTAVSCIELMSEVYAFGEKSGIDSEVINEFYKDAFAHPALIAYADKLQVRQFSSAGGFTLKGGLKDVRLMLDASSQAGVSFDIAKIIEKKMLLAMERGHENEDWSVFSEITRLDTGELND